VGDRRDEDTIELGRLAGEIFDEIIIRHDKDSRGKSTKLINDLLIQGIRSQDPDSSIVIHIIPEEMRAIAYALENATPDSVIAIFSEEISEAIKLVENFRVIQARQVLVE
jgi:cyanophycin synthetase